MKKFLMIALLFAAAIFMTACFNTASAESELVGTASGFVGGNAD